MADAGYPAFAHHAYLPLQLAAGWTTPGNPFTKGADPAYWIDGTGICHLRGRAYLPAGAGGSPTQISVAAPAPFDGAREWFITTIGTGDTNPSSWGVVAVINSNLLYYGGTPPDVYVDLSGITYPT